MHRPDARVDSMTTRTRPDRALTHTFDALSAEVARQCIAEWNGWRIDGHGDRRAACERMAILADLGRQQAAIELERKTGEPVPRWQPKRSRAELADRLEVATDGNPEVLSWSVVVMLRTEVERPWTMYATDERTTA